MSNSDYNEADKARQQAAEDLADIAELKRTVSFSRYWLRHLAKRKNELAAAFKNDPPAKCSPEERETLRRLLLFCEELEAMPDQHAASAAAFLDRNA